MKANFFRTGKKKGGSAHKAEPVRQTAPFDWWLFIIVMVLLAIGVIMVLSASGIVAEKQYADKYYFFNRQLIFACLGGVCLWIAALFPRHLLYRLHYILLGLALVTLALTLTPLAPAINGAKRWIPLGLFNMQPMEFVKIALVIYLGYYLSAKQELVRSFTRGMLPPLLITCLLCVLLLLQPDFGSAVVLFGILFSMYIAGGVRNMYLCIAGGVGVLSVAMLAILSPYRMRRLTSFLDPFQDAQNTGYQVTQSLYAFGSGGVFGTGIGASRQKMFYLPEAHNDFIMAVLGEELGFVGVSLVMLLFLLLFWRCYRIVMGQESLRDRLTAFGLSVTLAMGAVLNMAVVMSCAPPKGVPMPFLSYGGSNLLATLLCVGLLMNYSRTVRS